MPDIGLRQVFHLLILGYYVYFDKFVFTVLIHDVSTVEQLKDNLLQMTPQFATVWTQFVFQDYFLLSCLEDVLEWTPKNLWVPFKQMLSDHVNNLYVCYLLPFSLVMCANFWIIFFNDPRLIDEYNVLFEILDHSTNHAVHTNVIAILLAEMFITCRRYPAAVTVVYPYLKISVILGFYFAVVFGMKLFSPIWPYPYFKAMSAVQWVPYILANLFLTFSCYVLGFFCNALIWGESPEGSEQRQSTKKGVSEAATSAWRNLSRMMQFVESRCT